MRRQPHRWMGAIALGAMLVASGSIEAAAARSKEGVRVTVRGHHIHFSLKHIEVATNTGDDVGVIGSTVPPHLKTISVECSQSLAGGVFPVTGQDCGIEYSALKLGKHGGYQMWVGRFASVQVTIDSFDGSRVTGTFAGTLDPFMPTTPRQKPITIKGTFDVPAPPFNGVTHK